MTLSPHLHRGGEALSQQAKRDVTPIDKPLRREKSRSRLSRKARLRPSSTRKLKYSQLGRCTEEQRERVRDRACIVCAEHRGECHPAHVIDRATVSAELADDVRAVVPLCAHCHREYDEGDLDLSPYLEPSWRDSVAWAVEAVGLFRALRRITGQRWQAVEPELTPIQGDVS